MIRPVDDRPTKEDVRNLLPRVQPRQYDFHVVRRSASGFVSTGRSTRPLFSDQGSSVTISPSHAHSSGILPTWASISELM